jgi:apolipoprotein N-acyltransferase
LVQVGLVLLLQVACKASALKDQIRFSARSHLLAAASEPTVTITAALVVQAAVLEPTLQMAEQVMRVHILQQKVQTAEKVVQEQIQVAVAVQVKQVPMAQLYNLVKVEMVQPHRLLVHQ